jgi:hypothetical protein
MKRIIIGVERSKFNYLYKYNICTVSTVNIIEYSYPQLLEFYKSNLDAAASIIEKALPVFESEHEVILLEVDSCEVGYSLEFRFNAVKLIIPLNELARELLQSKLNSDFLYATPIPTDLYEATLALREDKLRSKAALSVLSCFNLPTPATPFTNLVKRATRRLIFNEKISKEAETIDFLLEFNTTPSGIPSGNIEGLMKIICVGMLKVTGNLDKLRLSPLFNLLLDNLELLNQGTLLSCYQNFQKISDKNRDKVEKLEATLVSKKVDSDLFLLLFLFISFKKELQKNDFDLKTITSDINEIKSIYSQELSEALYLIGYTLSIGVLHESIHRLSFSPLFKVEKAIQNERHTTKDVLIIAPADVPETLKPRTFEEAHKDSELHGISQYMSSTDLLHNNDENLAAIAESDELHSVDHSSNKLDVRVLESRSDSSFEIMEESQIENLLNEAKRKLKGPKRKELFELVDTLYKQNVHFSYALLEKKILSNNIFMKKDGSPIKLVQSLLDIFKPLSDKK